MQFDPSQSVLVQNGDPQATPLRMLECPSDEAQGRFYSDPAVVEGNPKLAQGKRFAKGNYAAFISPYHASYADWWPSGLSGVHRYTRKSIKDGTSKTLLLSEIRTRETELDQRGAWALSWTGASLLAFDMHDTRDFIESAADFQQDCLKSSEFFFHPATYSLGFTQVPNNLGPNMDMLYRCPDAAGAQLEGMPCATFVAGSDSAYLSAAPRSRHPGGVNVVFSDGHVGFLPDTIDEMTMAYLISSNDGQTLDLSSVR